MLGIGEVVTNEDDTLYLQRSINNRRNSHNLLSLPNSSLVLFLSCHAGCWATGLCRIEMNCQSANLVPRTFSCKTAARAQIYCWTMQEMVLDVCYCSLQACNIVGHGRRASAMNRIVSLNSSENINTLIGIWKTEILHISYQLGRYSITLVVQWNECLLIFFTIRSLERSLNIHS